MTRLSKNFTLEEFTRSQTAARMGRLIVPTDEQAERIKALVLNVLQPLRTELGLSITITSGIRPEWLNTAIGGSKTSQHMEGEAADFVAAGASPKEVCKVAMALGLPFDQLISEFGEWVHASYLDVPRNEVLTAFYDGGTKYTEGLV